MSPAHRAAAERRIKQLPHAQHVGSPLRAGDRASTASAHLLAAIHDGQAEQTELLHRIRDLLAVMAEPKGDPCPCECRRDVEPKPESDTLVEAGPESAPRVLICTEREADAQREIRRRVITTYQIEDEPAVLRGCDGADMTTAALVWLEQFVEAVDPDTHVAYMGQPTNRQEAGIIDVHVPDMSKVARDVLAAARPAIEREAKAAAWAEGYLAAAIEEKQWSTWGDTDNPYRKEQ